MFGATWFPGFEAVVARASLDFLGDARRQKHDVENDCLRTIAGDACGSAHCVSILACPAMRKNPPSVHTAVTQKDGRRRGGAGRPNEEGGMRVGEGYLPRYSLMNSMDIMPLVRA